MSKAREIANKLIDGMNDVTITSPVDGQLLKWNGTAWVNETGVIVKNGNVGIGVTPKGSTYTALQLKNTASVIGVTGVDRYNLTNAYYDGAWKRIVTTYKPTRYSEYDGGYSWASGDAGAADGTITWKNTMTLDASGTVSIINATDIENTQILALGASGIAYTALYLAKGIGFNSSASGMLICKNTSTNRSINASGTINASGADYAEYEYNNGIPFAKGQIVGFKADGTLTDKYSEAIRFAIKSTNPSYVGGDTWGSEDIVGKKPEQPTKADGMSDDDFTKIEAQYKIDIADFEAKLEVERQKVDRIAYSGKVPVNVYGAKAGQYVIVVERDGGIDGKLVNKSDMTFAEYQNAVGRVNKILDDGRAEVAVIIH